MELRLHLDSLNNIVNNYPESELVARKRRIPAKEVEPGLNLRGLCTVYTAQRNKVPLPGGALAVRNETVLQAREKEVEPGLNLRGLGTVYTAQRNKVPLPGGALAVRNETVLQAREKEVEPGLNLRGLGTVYTAQRNKVPLPGGALAVRNETVLQAREVSVSRRSNLQLISADYCREIRGTLPGPARSRYFPLSSHDCHITSSRRSRRHGVDTVWGSYSREFWQTRPAVLSERPLATANTSDVARALRDTRRIRSQIEVRTTMVQPGISDVTPAAKVKAAILLLRASCRRLSTILPENSCLHLTPVPKQSPWIARSHRVRAAILVFAAAQSAYEYRGETIAPSANSRRTQGTAVAKRLRYNLKIPKVKIPLPPPLSVASRQGEPGFNPPSVNSGFSQVGIVPDDAAGRLGFLGGLSFPPAPSFRRLSVPTSFHPHRLSQDLDSNSRPNLFTRSRHTRQQNGVTGDHLVGAQFVNQRLTHNHPSHPSVARPSGDHVICDQSQGYFYFLSVDPSNTPETSTFDGLADGPPPSDDIPTRISLISDWGELLVQPALSQSNARTKHARGVGRERFGNRGITNSFRDGGQVWIGGGGGRGGRFRGDKSRVGAPGTVPSFITCLGSGDTGAGRQSSRPHRRE
ncbi:hypothetical protein PR048_026059 [Dryococelus australis]|uniref:Uncharacterized protein n=1 Tax=Dryococelus australis TaxID=614101 RepID=A0ABQ9GKA7_9NEOP|nr:hypothetical protein PR048_026059 [Dryococelus australis]